MTPLSGRYSYYEDGESQTVVLCYQSGMAMYVILPAGDTDPQRFQQGLSSGEWESRLARLENARALSKIPRFKLDYHARLKPAAEGHGDGASFRP